MDVKHLPPKQPHVVWAGVLFGLLFPTAVTLSYFVIAGTQPAAVQQITYAVLKCAQFAFPAVWVCLVQRESRLQSERSGQSGRGGVVLGLAMALAATLLMGGIYYGGVRSMPLFSAAAEAVRQKLQGFGLDTIPKYAAVALFYSLIHSFLEEYYWRWFVFGQLRRLIPVAVAIGVSALGFTLHHVLVLGHYFGWASWATWSFSLAVAAAGCFWAWLYQRSQSLYGPWLSHMVLDMAIFWIGYELVRG